MITNLAERIALLFIQKGWGVKENQEIYRYGCEVLLSLIVNISLVLICGLLFHMVGKGFLFYACFLLLRRYCGGYHAETYLGCAVAFILVLVSAFLLISNYIKIPSVVLVVVPLISYIVIICFAPIIHKNKQLNDHEISLYRKVAILITGCFVGLALGLLNINREMTTIIVSAIMSVAVLMVVNKIAERRKSV